MVSLVLVLLFVTLSVAIYFRKRPLLWYSVGVFLSLLFMVLSNTLYMRTLTNVSFGLGIDKAIIVFCDKIFSMTISNLRILSMYGEIILLTLLMIISGNLIKKKGIFYLFSICCIGIYAYICSPDVMFGLYVDINSANPAVSQYAKDSIAILDNVKKIIISCFALCPYILCFFKYKKTILIFKKKEILSEALYVALVETLMLLCVFLNVINNLFESSYEIFYKGNLPEVYAIESYGFVSFALFIILMFIIVAKGNLSRKYYTRFNIKGIYGVSRLDKSLKMVLHTYKNIFFLIRQLSEEDMYDETLNERSKAQLLKINSLSENALYGITKQIKMFSAIENETESFNLSECINQAMSNLDSKEQSFVNINYLTDERLIKSDSYYLSDAIYNILKNAIEAVSRSSEPKVDINVLYEDEWFLIELSDNGDGIEKHRLKEIFKPLVSYKNGRDNWGIGLYYSYKIVNTLSGYLYVQSEVNKYTKFQMYIPQNVKEKR